MKHKLLIIQYVSNVILDIFGMIQIRNVHVVKLIVNYVQMLISAKNVYLALLINLIVIVLMVNLLDLTIFAINNAHNERPK